MNNFQPIIKEIGTVTEAHDGIVLIEGLPSIMAEEEFVCANGVRGMCLGFDEYTVKGVLFERWETVLRGTEVKPQGRLLAIPVGEEFVGRIINPLGRALDGKTDPKPKVASGFTAYPVEGQALPVIDRAAVSEPIITGIKAIDALIPIGRGQRELILGDAKIGKTSLALDAVISQKESARADLQPITCVFVSCGQKNVELARTVEILRKTGALAYTVVVAATASDPASLQYIAPYAGMAMAEYFRDKGGDVLVVLDDLSKHAWAWRELSAMLERIPGREGYPGDVFYLHSRLLERAGRKKDGGSITALPIVQTQEGEISAYIATNTISITDGQIYLETDIFNRGTRPAINVGLSVSRVGGKAQHPLMRALTKGLRLKLAQYEEMLRVGGLEVEVSEERKKELAAMRSLHDVFMQKERAPLELELQCLMLFAAQEGMLEALTGKGTLGEFEESVAAAVRTHFPALRERVWNARDMEPGLAAEFRKVLTSLSSPS